MRFQDQARAFKSFLRTVPPPPPTTGRRAALLVTPWVLTAVPWFAIALGLLYRARGWKPALIFDDGTPPNPTEKRLQIPLISEALEACGLEVRRLSEIPEEPLHEGDAEELAGLARINAEAYLRRSGVTEAAAEGAFLEALRWRLGRFHTVARSGKWDHFCVPGGLYGGSGAMRLAGRRAGCRVACYDSGPGCTTIGVDWIAGHCRDLSRIFDTEYAPYLAAHRERAIALGREEFELRRSARDRYGYAAAAYQEHPQMEPCDVLIPMNVFDDAAGLGRSRFFANGAEWVEETATCILQNTTARVTVREHPGARALGRQDLVGPRLRERHGGNPRFRFVSCHEAVSTYALLEEARVVLPFASTVGVEAAALGKQVVVESDVYYGGFPFVQRADSRADYFARIRRTLEAPEPLTPELREQAWLTYFFGQVASFVDCNFAPQPGDFAIWSRMPFAELSADPKAHLVVTALSEGIPSWRLQSEQIFAGEYRVPKREDTPPLESSWWRRLLQPAGARKN